MNWKSLFRYLLLGGGKPSKIEKACMVICTVCVLYLTITLFSILHTYNPELVSREINPAGLYELGRNITRFCGSIDCVYDRVESYVLYNVSPKYDSFPEDLLNLHNDPSHTLTQGGDCENQAILALSILKALGKQDLYLVLQRGHACWLANVFGELRFFNCDPQLEIREVYRVG